MGIIGTILCPPPVHSNPNYSTLILGFVYFLIGIFGANWPGIFIISFVEEVPYEKIFPIVFLATFVLYVIYILFAVIYIYLINFIDDDDEIDSDESKGKIVIFTSFLLITTHFIGIMLASFLLYQSKIGFTTNYIETLKIGGIALSCNLVTMLILHYIFTFIIFMIKIIKDNDELDEPTQQINKWLDPFNIVNHLLQKNCPVGISIEVCAAPVLRELNYKNRSFGFSVYLLLFGLIGIFLANIPGSILIKEYFCPSTPFGAIVSISMGVFTAIYAIYFVLMIFYYYIYKIVIILNLLDEDEIESGRAIAIFSAGIIFIIGIGGIISSFLAYDSNVGSRRCSDKSKLELLEIGAIMWGLNIFIMLILFLIPNMLRCLYTFIKKLVKFMCHKEREKIELEELLIDQNDDDDDDDDDDNDLVINDGDQNKIPLQLCELCSQDITVKSLSKKMKETDKLLEEVITFNSVCSENHQKVTNYYFTFNEMCLNFIYEKINFINVFFSSTFPNVRELKNLKIRNDVLMEKINRKQLDLQKREQNLVERDMSLSEREDFVWKEEEELDGKLDELRYICPICKSNYIQYIYDPCGHGFCNKCITKKNNKCHVCRNSIDKTLKIYM